MEGHIFVLEKFLCLMPNFGLIIFPLSFFILFPRFPVLSASCFIQASSLLTMGTSSILVLHGNEFLFMESLFLST